MWALPAVLPYPTYFFHQLDSPSTTPHPSSPDPFHYSVFSVAMRSIKRTGNQHTGCANHDPSRQDTLVSATIFSGPVVALHPPQRPLSTKYVEAVKRWEMSTRRAGANARRATETSTLSGGEKYHILESKGLRCVCQSSRASSVFFRVPISGAANGTRKGTVTVFKLGNAIDELGLNLVPLIFQLPSWFSFLRVRKET